MGFALTCVVLSFVLLAAHFSRHDLSLLAPLCLAIPLLLLVRREWVPGLLQLLLIVGALEWLRTTLFLAAQRLDTGQPWLRMALILAVVVLFTLGSAMLLRTAAVRHHYGPELDRESTKQ
jgi:hypothetical protein